MSRKEGEMAAINLSERSFATQSPSYEDNNHQPSSATSSLHETSQRLAAQSNPSKRMRNIKNSEEESSEHLSAQENVQSAKRASSARKSVRASRRSLAPKTDVLQLESTTEAAESSEISLRHIATAKTSHAPLGDITDAVVNEQRQEYEVAKQADQDELFRRPAPERPMDIVIRARAKAVPQPHDTQLPIQRTVITYLVLENFKSYAGRQEVGPFHASFSSVVGPNGSGKSNVIDSLLFVFGFRASKMRQGKISSLIHNSAAYPDLDHCEVEVHFEEVKDLSDGQKEVLPASALVISRRAFRNNSSKYYINGKESNFTAVTTLLKDRGVDLDHKRFLILQGEVESIAQMKPKAANEHDDGLLEYLEDIIGTSKYKNPIEESLLETETLNEVCIEKNSRVQHVEKEKRSLEGKKNAAIEYIRNENDLAIKQSALCQIFVHECNDNIQVTEEAIKENKSQLAVELERHHGGEEVIRQLESQYGVHLKQFQKLQQSTEAILKQLAKVDRETVKFEEKRKHLSAKIKKCEKTVATSGAGVAESSAYLLRLSDDLERNGSEVFAIQKTLKEEEIELEKVRKSLKGKTESLSIEIGGKQKQLEPWTAQINDRNSAIAVAQSELSMLQDRKEAGAQALSDLEARISQLRLERSEKVVQIAEHDAMRVAREEEVQSIQSALAELSKREPQVKARLSAATQKTDEARSNLAKSQTQGNVLAGLTRLKESGRIEGFHGRLGNLGTIDEKYDVAISTACPALENLVVDTVDGGQRCIEHLRKNNLGRANFILLDRLTQRDVGPIATPENVPRLFDLVKFKEERFRPAFYNVMQNTLVAEDLAQANRIAYGHKRWRVVTLDGQLIDKSGAMSGGGNRVAKGAMSSKLVMNMSKEQVAILESEQETEEKHFQDFQQKSQSLKASLKTAQEEIPGNQIRLQRWQLEVDSIDRNLADCQRRQVELQASKKPDMEDQNRITALQRIIRTAEEDIAKFQRNTCSIEDEIKNLQDKIMEIGGVKLRMQKAKVDGLREQITTLSDEMASAEANQTKTQKQQAKHQKSKLQAENDLMAVCMDVEKLEHEAKSHAQDAIDTKRDANKAEEVLESKEDQMRILLTEVEQKKSELNATRGTEIEIRNKLEENQKALAENIKRLNYWQSQLSKLKVQDLSDVEEQSTEQSLATYTRDELADLDKTTLKGEIALLEEKTQNADFDPAVIEDYRRRVEEHAERAGDLAQAVATRDTAKRRCEELRRLRLEGFMEGFSIISLRLKEMYQMITMGGNAELELVDSLDPFSEGILFSVMPPKKSWKNISNLSGGEKTLSSLALVFALHHYKPTPLYVMDEIDAALDFRNVSIVASYIKERTRNAQFIVISLRNNMFELASRLVGVYKVNHMTKSVTVENRDYIVRSGSTGVLV